MLMNNRPTLRQISAFLSVAEAGSFSAAAERLGSTQPAVSQAVRDLEGTLGLRLFNRTTRRVNLTEAGLELRDRLQEGVDLLDSALARARNVAELRVGHLRLAAPPQISATVLPPLLADFARQHPGVTYDLADVVAAEIPDRVRNGLADLGLGTFGSGEPGLDRRVLLTDVMMLVCRPDHQLAQGQPRWQDLAAVPIVALEKASGLRSLMDSGFRAADLVPEIQVTVRLVGTALALVEAGLGVAIMPSYVLRGRSDRLVSLPLGAPALRRELVMIRHVDRAQTPVAQEFARHVLRAFSTAYRADGVPV